MLGRDGTKCVLIDPYEVHPQEFRCEKLDGPQVEILRQTGLAEPVLGAATPDGTNWVARYGVVVERRIGDQHGIYYGPLVNTVRAQIPNSVPLIRSKVTGISSSAGLQTLTLDNGQKTAARLVLLANGLSVSLRDQLNLERHIVSRCHVIAVGFTMRPRGRASFDFPALTYYAERPADRAAHITIFPIGSGMRANLFVYREMDDPWLKEVRRAPQEALYKVMPNLRRIVGEFEIEGRVEIRPIDLYVTKGHLQPGLVLAGDAFATSCPAAGIGARKVLTDVERLCNTYIPEWLATSGMSTEKIAAFYNDPIKRACDELAFKKSMSLKSLSTSRSAVARAERLARAVGQVIRSSAKAKSFQKLARASVS
jgi:2-polyprenyl-6-methoxyphenol hydroxylase-like FAD-dependent oxidoreductase